MLALVCPPRSLLLRHFTTSVTLLRPKAKPVRVVGALTNYDIKAREILLVDKTESGLADHLTPEDAEKLRSNKPVTVALSKVLDNLDLNRFAVEVVKEDTRPLLCAVKDRSQEYARLKARKESKKESPDAQLKKRQGKPPKQLQLTWSSAENDFEHKLDKAEELLLKGYKVVIQLETKRGQSSVGLREKEARLRLIEQRLASCAQVAKTSPLTERVVMVEFKRLASLPVA